MNQAKYIQRSLAFFRKQHLAVFFAALISTAVLTGALIVGDSVKYSLKKLVATRLGKIEYALSTGDRFVRKELATQIGNDLNINTASVLLMQGIAINTDIQKRINKVQIIGIDADFWKLSAIEKANLKSDEVIISRNIAEKLKLEVGHELLLRIRNSDIIPLNAPFTSDENSNIAVRVIVTGIANENSLGRFSMRNNQSAPYNIFIDRDFLAEKLALPGLSNLIVSTGSEAIRQTDLNEALRKNWVLKDLALEFRTSEKSNTIELISNRIFIDKSITNKVNHVKHSSNKLLTYFVNSIKSKGKETPYSFVTAASASFLGEEINNHEIIINSWMADDLQVSTGDSLEMSFYTIGPLHTLNEVSEKFIVSQVIAMDDVLADKSLMPAFPGLTDADNCTDWETGIPIDLKKIRDKDEEYWTDYKGTPKAFISIEKGLQLWENQFGNYTAIRFKANEVSKTDLEKEILSILQPLDINLQFVNVHTEGNRSAEMGVDFGELFLSLSFFVIAAALLLMLLIYGLNLESRKAETGILYGLGFTKKQILKFYFTESIPTILTAAIIGGFAGILYNNLMLSGLNSIWNDAIHQGSIELHINLQTIVIGVLTGILTSLLSIYFVTRKNLKKTVVSSIGKSSGIQNAKQLFYSRIIGSIGIGGALMITVYAVSYSIENNAGMVLGAGFLFLIGCVAFVAGILHLKSKNSNKSAQLNTLGKLALINVKRTKGRSLAVVALLAVGTFTIIVTGANRQTFSGTENQRQSGTGGFKLWIENTVPLLYNLNTSEGKEFYGLTGEEVLQEALFVQCHRLAGDDASCLNLNQVQQPQILSVNPELLDSLQAFSFSNLLSKTEHPWHELNKNYGNDIIPAIADQTVIQWGLMKSVGDTLLYYNESGEQIKILLVGGLNSSVFQGNLLIAEGFFLKNYPSAGGSSIMLVEGPEEKITAIEDLVSNALSDYGIEITSAPKRLAAFYAVTNTYLSIFMFLGGLGVIIGTLGIGIVLVRNMLERKQEIALYEALGFRKSQIFKLVLTENLFLLFTGIAVGSISAVIGILPSLLSPAYDIPGNFLLVIISIVVVSGFLWIYFPARSMMKKQLIRNLRKE